ncbi:MAG: hypothetical protein R2729_21170 [Bryobacteraceae bacterium]
MNRTETRLVVAAAAVAVLTMWLKHPAVAAYTYYKVDGFTTIDATYLLHHWSLVQSGCSHVPSSCGREAEQPCSTTSTLIIGRANDRAESIAVGE